MKYPSVSWHITGNASTGWTSAVRTFVREKPCRLRLTLLAVLAIGVIGCRRGIPAPPPAEAPGTTASCPASISLYFADYRKVSAHDPGSVRLHFRVPPDAPPIKEVLFSDRPILVWGLTNLLFAPVTAPESVALPFADGEPQVFAPEMPPRTGITWARLRSPDAHDGGLAELVIKLEHPLSMPGKVTVVDAAGATLNTVVRPLPRRLTLEAIRFSPDMTTALCHLQWMGDACDCRVERVEVDGMEVSPKHWRDGGPLPASAQTVVAIKPVNGFQAGRECIIRIDLQASEGSFSSAERVRALSFFPLASERGAIRLPQLDFVCPDVTIYRNREVLPDDALKSRIPDHPHISRVFGCAMHTYAANLTRSAQHVFATHERAQRLVPSAPTTIHMCRIRPEEGYALFGETTDTLRYQPLFSNKPDIPAGGADPVTTVERLSGCAVAAAAPRPAHCVLPTSFGKSYGTMSPVELRRLVYTALGRGAGGMLFRHKGWTHEDEFTRHMAALFRELESIRPHLENACFVASPTVAAGGAQATAYLLRSGLNTGLLIFVSHDARDEALISIDAGILPAGVSFAAVAPGGLSPYQPVRSDQGRLQLPVANGASAYVIIWPEMENQK